MKLLYQTHSPYARKVLVAAHEMGLADQMQVEHHETSPTRRNEAVYAANPLGRVPVLLTDGGEVFFDSDVICAYLDSMHIGRKLIPARGAGRWPALTFQAVAQGLCEIGGALRWETVRRPPELRFAPLQTGYTQKLIASYDWLEQRIAGMKRLDIGAISLATALDWLEFRALPSFRPGRPRLAAWLDQFSHRPSMQATKMSGETYD